MKNHFGGKPLGGTLYFLGKLVLICIVWWITINWGDFGYFFVCFPS